VVEAKRKKGETFESFYRRFSKRLQQSGRLFLARKIRFHDKGQNKTERRRSAIFKINARSKREFLKKTGQLKEDERKPYYK